MGVELLIFPSNQLPEKSHHQLYQELWKACAGPLVDVPRDGERVFYFPLGHMEQLEESNNQQIDQSIPHFNLKSMLFILSFCKEVLLVLINVLKTLQRQVSTLSAKS
ncbi:unnamed protein product [Lactuca virosa]|uniref:JmjC domain-containing protein n=1 Tax=Lactuca virosa TaxID=75947 RepID=A0AAU9MPV6_9ASTR|nr:unnamed protein product [Lactuca virosa]